MLANRDITVTIPYYNREKYIDEAIRSVQAKSRKPLQIIIVNDGSRESLRRYLDRYRSECTIVHLDKNVGAAAARNEGNNRASATFVAFLDDDNVRLPHKLEVQGQYMEDHPRCGAVHSAPWASFSGQEDVRWNRDWSGPITLAQALTDGYFASMPTTLVRRDVLSAFGGLDPKFPIAEERDSLPCVRFFGAFCVARAQPVNASSHTLFQDAVGGRNPLHYRPAPEAQPYSAS